MIRSKLIISIGLFLFIGMSSCNRDGYSVSKTGLHYRLIETKDGKKPHEGDILKMHLTYKNQKDSLLYDSRVLGDSFLIELTRPTSKGGLEEGFAMMGEGDSASFLVSADSIFDKLFHLPLPSYLHKGETLSFNVRLQKIMSRDEMNKMLSAKAAVKSNDEAQAIDDYLLQNNIVVNPVRNGFYFISFVEGKGDFPVSGDEVAIKYLVRSLKGKVLDSSEGKDGVLNIVLGQNNYLPAWEEAIGMMKKGGVARLILSSANAYGDRQSGPIPPNTALVFDMELIDVKPKKAS